MLLGMLISHDEFVELLDEAAREKGFQSWADAEAKWVAKNGKAAGWHNDMLNDYSEIVESLKPTSRSSGTLRSRPGTYPGHDWGGDDIRSRQGV